MRIFFANAYLVNFDETTKNSWVKGIQVFFDAVVIHRHLHINRRNRKGLNRRRKYVSLVAVVE